MNCYGKSNNSIEQEWSSITRILLFTCNRLSDIEPGEVEAEVEASSIKKKSSPLPRRISGYSFSKFSEEILQASQVVECVCVFVWDQPPSSTPTQFSHFPAGPAGTDTDWERVDQ